MNYKESWETSLAQGELGEVIIAEYLKEKGYNILEFNKTIEWDIKIEKDGFIKTVEIKTDRYEYFTGKITNNIFLEQKCNGRKSGLLASTADYFIYFFPDYELAYLIKMSDCRELLHYGTRRSLSGDKGKVTGVTINRFEFSDRFKIFNIKKSPLWKGVKDEL